MALVDLEERSNFLGGAVDSDGSQAAEIGSVIVNSSASTTFITSQGSYSVLQFGTSAALGPDNNGFSLASQTNATLEYEGDGTYDGVMTFFLLGNMDTIDAELEFRATLNGSAFPTVFTPIVDWFAAEQRSTTFHIPFTGVVNGDEIRLVVRNNSSTDNIIFRYFTFRIDPLTRFAASVAVPSVFEQGAVFAVTTSTGVLGFKSVYGCTDTSAPRTLTISSADILLGTPSQPWVFSVTDQSGGAGTNAITIDTEGAELISGGASIQITEDFAGVTLYSDGSNLFVQG